MNPFLTDAREELRRTLEVVSYDVQRVREVRKALNAAWVHGTDQWKRSPQGDEFRQALRALNAAMNRLTQTLPEPAPEAEVAEFDPDEARELVREAVWAN